MQKPSVLGLVSYKVFPPLMGGQKCIVDFYQHLKDHANITLALSKENTAISGANFATETFLYNHWMGLLNLRYLYRLIRLIQKKQIDIIIIEHSYFGWLGLLLRFFTKKKIVFRLHNVEGFRFKDMQRSWWELYLRYEKWACRKADQLWFTSSADMEWMIHHWQIERSRCTGINFGVMQDRLPEASEKMKARDFIIHKHGLPQDTSLFLFNGSLDYIPNTDAIRIIVYELLPRLLRLRSDFRIVICGSQISKDWEVVLGQIPQILFEGFVPDISLYFKGCDCFINPVTLGSGLQTKMVEALAADINIVSVRSSIKGIDPVYSGEKISIVEDYGWDEFVFHMNLQTPGNHPQTPAAFFDAFYWKQIVRKAALSLQSL